jgi:ketosteroid isomerase-like protein
MYAAIDARDRDQIRALTDPDIEIRTTVEAHRGPEGLLAWLDEGDEAFDDFAIDMERVEEIDGHVVVSMRQGGRGKASGAEVDSEITHVWALRDGRATGLRSFASRDDAVGYANVELIRSRHALALEQGFEAVMDVIHPDFQATTPPSLASEPDTYRGHDGIRRWFDSFGDAMEGVYLEGVDFTAIGDKVLVETLLHARGRATGIDTAQRAFVVWTLRDGLVTAVEMFPEREQALAAARRG